MDNLCLGKLVLVASGFGFLCHFFELLISIHKFCDKIKFVCFLLHMDKFSFLFR
jgi:hypothetical protein